MGTLFDQLSFSLPYPQPPPVIEAFVRRVVAVRCVVAGRAEQATSQLLTAEMLLTETPIDRTYQMSVDAEAQFEVFQLSELQERFILAHELAHYIRAVDPSAFNEFEKRMLQKLKSTSYETLPSSVLLGTYGDRHHAELSAYRHDLDPHSWFLRQHLQHGVQDFSSPQLGAEVSAALETFHATSSTEREEVMCDILAGTAVSLDAHVRRKGWNVAMSAACARLAVSNLHTILGVDRWVQDEGQQPLIVNGRPTTRERCMNAFLPIIIPATLTAFSDGTRTTPNDLHLIMRLVEARFRSENQTAFQALTWDPGGPTHEALSREAILVRAGFIHLRPNPDHGATRRAAVQPLFNLGTIEVTVNVSKSCSDPKFARDLDAALVRHQRGDWDNLPPEDGDANRRGLFEEGEPTTDARLRRRDSIWSVLETDDGPIWIITNRARAKTSIEYAFEH